MVYHDYNVQVAQVTEEEKRLLEEGGDDDEPPAGVDFITFMMHAGKMDVDTIATNAVDLMAAGVDTVQCVIHVKPYLYGGGARNCDNVAMNNDFSTDECVKPFDSVVH